MVRQWKRRFEAGATAAVATNEDVAAICPRRCAPAFGETAATAPHAIQWLSDNGPQHTATASVLSAHELGLVPITTPAYSPESNGLAEAFVLSTPHVVTPAGFYPLGVRQVRGIMRVA